MGGTVEMVKRTEWILAGVWKCMGELGACVGWLDRT